MHLSTSPLTFRLGRRVESDTTSAANHTALQGRGTAQQPVPLSFRLCVVPKKSRVEDVEDQEG